jgi:hypothetical protein
MLFLTVSSPARGFQRQCMQHTGITEGGSGGGRVCDIHPYVHNNMFQEHTTILITCFEITTVLIKNIFIQTARSNNIHILSEKNTKDRVQQCF